MFDVSQPAGSRARAVWLQNEDDSVPPSPRFTSDDHWTLKLTDPHSVARLIDQPTGIRFWGNPYTRYTLLQILTCTLSLSDAQFANGSLDSRASALALGLQAKEILAFDELLELQPLSADQVYLPNPAVAAHRAHADASLSKLRRGLSFSGAPLPPDLLRGQRTGRPNLVRPTPYRFKVLIERAKQLAAQAQQIEAQYLAAIEGGEAEAEKLMTAGFAQFIARQTLELRARQETEATDGQRAAELQRSRTQIQADRYQQWIDAGLNGNEQAQLDGLRQVHDLKDILTDIQTGITFNSEMAAAAIPWTIPGHMIVQGLAIDKGEWEKTLNQAETNVQLSGIRASQERRSEEWQLQRDLAKQDLLIGDQQIVLASDRVLIAQQESLIADDQARQAEQLVTFLTNKFTNVEFFDWLQGVLAGVYAFFLRVASSIAQQAELQLAFEQQEPPAGLIKADYWAYTPQIAASAAALDRRGITGSARLLQDIYTLDQQAFSSERRLLNLTHSVSLARMMPVEFAKFRRSGMLAFATPMSMVTEGFPGHYMCAVKAVRMSVIALIPPSQGIRATLTNSGLSRVVTADPGYPVAVIQQDSESVALTSPIASTGVFEVDMQSEMLNPFEGTGLDTTWFFELPPAGNPIDFDSLMDVVMTIDYTARSSNELRERVVSQLPRRTSSDLAFSVRRDLPDAWYDLANPADGTPVRVELTLNPSRFPPGLSEISIDEIAVVARLRDGSDPQVRVHPSFMQAGSSTRTDGAQPADLIKGIASSRQSGADSWAGLRGRIGATATWRFDFTDIDTRVFSLAEALKDGQVDDILTAFTFSGVLPAWR